MAEHEQRPAPVVEAIEQRVEPGHGLARVGVDAVRRGLGGRPRVRQREPAPHPTPPQLGSRHPHADPHEKAADQRQVPQTPHGAEELEEGLLDLILDVRARAQDAAEDASDRARESVPHRPGRARSALNRRARQAGVVEPGHGGRAHHGEAWAAGGGREHGVPTVVGGEARRRLKIREAGRTEGRNGHIASTERTIRRSGWGSVVR